MQPQTALELQGRAGTCEGCGEGAAAAEEVRESEREITIKEAKLRGIRNSCCTPSFLPFAPDQCHLFLHNASLTCTPSQDHAAERLETEDAVAGKVQESGYVFGCNSSMIRLVVKS